MKKNANFAAPNPRTSVEVTLTPVEDGKIQYRFAGKVVDNNNEPVPNVKVLAADDDIWNLVFGGARGTKRFLKGKKRVRKVLPLGSLGLEDCKVKV